MNNSGHFDVSHSFNVNFPKISKLVDNPEYSQYFNLRPWIEKSHCPVYYFMAGKYQPEIEQYEGVKDLENIKCLSFNSNKHATTIFADNWAYILLDETVLKKYAASKKLINRYVFLFNTVPGKKAVYIFLHELKEFIKRRFFKW